MTPETINITQIGKSFNDPKTAEYWIYWMFLNLAGGLKGEILNVEDVAKGNDVIVTVEMSINDHEVQFSKVIERLRAHFDDIVNKRVQEIVSERFSEKMMDFTDSISDLQEQIWDMCRSKLGLPPEDSCDS